MRLFISSIVFMATLIGCSGSVSTISNSKNTTLESCTMDSDCPTDPCIVYTCDINNKCNPTDKEGSAYDFAPGCILDAGTGICSNGECSPCGELQQPCCVPGTPQPQCNQGQCLQMMCQPH